MRKAERALSAARLLVRADHAEGACNRAYRAMFEAKQAALLAALIALGHDALMETLVTTMPIAIGASLVNCQLIDAAHGRSLNQVRRLSRLADDTGEPISASEAAWAVDQAEAFVAAVGRKFPIQREGKP